MNLSTKPVVACYVFQESSWILVVKRLWRGAEYLGLPGAPIGVTEDFGEHARKLVAPSIKGTSNLVLIPDKGLGHWVWLGGNEDYEWNGGPAAISIFSFPDSKTIAPMTNQGMLVSLDKITGDFDPAFDVTLKLLRTVLEEKARRAVA